MREPLKVEFITVFEGSGEKGNDICLFHIELRTKTLRHHCTLMFLRRMGLQSLQTFKMRQTVSEQAIKRVILNLTRSLYTANTYKSISVIKEFSNRRLLY